MEEKCVFKTGFWKEIVIQGCQMFEFKLQIPKFLTNLIINLHFYFYFNFANLATLWNRQLCLLRQIKSEIKRR
jgi:hypothetical protein